MQDTDQDSGNIPLYPGASITVNITMVLLLAFAVRHKLTNEAISDLLYLIEKICPQPNSGCKTLYNFRKYFFCLLTPVNFCYYCINCFGLINNLAENAYLACGKAFTTVNDLSYFLHFSVSDQIKSLFARKDFLTICNIASREINFTNLVMRIFLMVHFTNSIWHPMVSWLTEVISP